MVIVVLLLGWFLLIAFMLGFELLLFAICFGFSVVCLWDVSLFAIILVLVVGLLLCWIAFY